MFKTEIITLAKANPNIAGRKLLTYANCLDSQVLYFQLQNTFEETINDVHYDLYVNGDKKDSI